MARAFTGTTGSEQLAAAAVPITGYPMTVAFWFRSTDSATLQIPFGLTDASSVSQHHAIELRGNVGDTVACITRAGGATRRAATSTTYSINTWHHACALFIAAADRKIYLDGGGEGTNAQSANWPSGIDVTSIGERGNANAATMIGRVAEVGIWDVELTLDQIASLANGVSPLRVRPANLVAYWPCYGIDGASGVERNYAGDPAATDLTAAATNSPAVESHAPVRGPWGIGGRLVVGGVAAGAVVNFAVVVDAVSSSNADLAVDRNMASVLDAVSASVSNIDVDRPLAVVVDAVSASTSVLAAERPLDAFALALSAQASALARDVGYASVLDAASSSVSEVAVDRNLSSALDAVSASAAALTVRGTVAFAVVVTALSNHSANIDVERPLAAVDLAVSSSLAALAAERDLAATAIALSAHAAVLGLDRNLEAVATALSAHAADLATDRNLAAAAIAISAHAAALATDRTLAATALALSAHAAVLGVDRNLAAIDLAVSSATAALTVVPFAGVVAVCVAAEPLARPRVGAVPAARGRVLAAPAARPRVRATLRLCGVEVDVQARVGCPSEFAWLGSNVVELFDVEDDLASPAVPITTAVSVQVRIFDLGVDPPGPETATEISASPLVLPQVAATNHWRATIDSTVANGFAQGQRLRLDYAFDGGAGIQGFFQALAVVTPAVS